MRFKVKSNYGEIYTSPNYEWDKEKGIPNEESILEDMEECTCQLHEDNPSCDGSCNIFEDGEVIEVVKEEG